MALNITQGKTQSTTAAVVPFLKSAGIDQSITVDQNALSVGPVVVEDGVTITVADGSRWVIV